MTRWNVERRITILPGLTAVLATLVLAGSVDARLAATAAHAPAGEIAAGVVLSRIGLSWYMLVLSGAAAAAGILAPRWMPDGQGMIRARGIAEGSIYVFATIAGSGLVCQAIKHIVGRARPRFLNEFGAFHFDGPNLHSGLDSFPSGHTTTIFAAAMALSLLAPAWRLPLFGVAILVGVARILAGAHYPSDVVAGAVLGTVMALWIARIMAARGLAIAAAPRRKAVDRRRRIGPGGTGR